jgi:hypothetical protein
MMKPLIIIGVFIVGFSTLATAQKQVRKDIREGNKEYKQDKYEEAEVAYLRAMETNARSTDAAYNLGNALYKQAKGQESFEQYKAVLGNETDKSKLSMAWHNVGNIFFASARDEEGNWNNEALRHSMEAYKNALRNNPKDDETRYNLALAQKLLKENENQEDNQQKQQDKDQQQEQDQQEQQQDQQERQQDQQQNPNEMSRQNAEQILDAMMQEEKNTQEKVKQQQMQQQKQRKTDKNW